MAITTYIFGAGASANVLPVVNQMESSLTDLLEKFELADYQLSDSEYFEDLPKNIDRSTSKRACQIEMIEELEILLQNIKDHTSIDAYGKKLSINPNGEKINLLDQLRRSMAVFIHLIQLGGALDKRYETFLATLHNADSLRKDIRIASWNYDLQFEIAGKSILGGRDVLNVQDYYGITVKGAKYSPSLNNFRIFKLNGDCTIENKRGTNFITFSPVNNHFDQETIERIVRNYMFLKHSDFDTRLSFAWEPEFVLESKLDAFIESVEDSTNLVIVGYSLPDFNREIDTRIISSMKFLQSVFIQDPYGADETEIKIRNLLRDLNKIRDVEIIKLTNNRNTFFIP